jgi:hypothetical protein
MVTRYFGRHKGKPLNEVPSDYLAWALRTVRLSSGVRAAREELLRLGVRVDFDRGEAVTAGAAAGEADGL